MMPSVLDKCLLNMNIMPELERLHIACCVGAWIACPAVSLSSYIMTGPAYYLCSKLNAASKQTVTVHKQTQQNKGTRLL